MMSFMQNISQLNLDLFLATTLQFLQEWGSADCESSNLTKSIRIQLQKIWSLIELR